MARHANLRARELHPGKLDEWFSQPLIPTDNFAEDFNFTLKVNHANDGNFDHIIIHHTSKESKGALFIQVKNWYRPVEAQKLLVSSQLIHHLSDDRTLWAIKHLTNTSPKPEQKTLFNGLQDKLMDAPKHEKSTHAKWVENALTTKTLDKNMLQTGLYRALTSDKTSKILHYRGSGDIMLNTAIIAQTVAIVPSCEAIFIENMDPEITEHLDRILMSPTDVFHSSVIVITIVSKLDNVTVQRIGSLMASNGSKWNRQTAIKIILLQQSTTDHPDPFLVRDLTSECRKELVERHETLQLFGTRASLDTMVLPTDSLVHLRHVLDLSSETQGKANGNINQQRYDNIKSWYIQRTICPYVSTIIGATASYITVNKHFGIDMSYIFFGFTSSDWYVGTRKPAQTLLRIVAPDGKPDNTDVRKFANEKMVILSDISGAGKTAYMTWLAWCMQSYEPWPYVILLTAAVYDSSFEWLTSHEHPCTAGTETIRTLFRLSRLARMNASVVYTRIREERKQTDRLADLLTFADGTVMLDECAAKELVLPSSQLIEIRLFREKFNRKQVIFMLDGADQVQPDCRTAVLQFVERLSHFDGVQQIILSTHPQCASSEISLYPKVRTYELRPLSVDDTMLLLHRTLLNRLDAYRQCDSELQTQLLPSLHGAIIGSLRNCRLDPLLLTMATSVFLPAIKQWVNFKNQRVEERIRLQLGNIDGFQLINTFIDEQLQQGETSLVTASATTTKKHEMSTTLKRQHALLGFGVMFGKRFTERFLTADERALAIKLMTHRGADIEKAGFVTVNHNGMVLFSNRIFAEYFAAWWLYENRARVGSKSHVMTICKTLSAKSFTNLRYFFDRISEGTEMLMDFCNKLLDPEYISELLPLGQAECLSGRDATGRTVLHWMAWNDVRVDSWRYDHVLKLTPPQLIDAKDELFRWSAVDYAFYTEKWDYLIKLLKHGANVNIDVWVHQLRSYEIVELFNRMANLDECLLNPYTTIPDTVLARHYLSAVSSGVVHHLIYDRDIDIRKPLAELDGLTVLECCAKRNLFGLFEHFISITDSSTELLNEVGRHLFALSHKHDAYRMAVYLMERCDFQALPLKQFEGVLEEKCDDFDLLSAAMELKSMKLFRQFFNRMCEKYQVPCIKDEEVVTETCNAAVTSDRSTVVFLVHPTHAMFQIVSCEMIIGEALYHTKFHIISYIVQKIKLTISHSILTSIFDTLSLQTRVLPQASTPILCYLLDRSNDLHGFDDNGQTLLHMAGSMGCAVTIQCLLDRGFNPLQTCASMRQNVFHYVAASVHDERAVEIFNQLQHYCSIDRFNVPNLLGFSVCEIAIMNRNWRLAGLLIHLKAYYFTTEQRVTAVLDCCTGLLRETQIMIGKKFMPLFANEYRSSNKRSIFDAEKLWSKKSRM
uniref:ANK_REP_REGION domain-containing protein n=1 Tax=Anopheles minimus TaxID=112268 RepID=A0A182W9F0_9DIPT